jgi:hypothetical protein
MSGAPIQYKSKTTNFIGTQHSFLRNAGDQADGDCLKCGVWWGECTPACDNGAARQMASRNAANRAASQSGNHNHNHN